MLFYVLGFISFGISRKNSKKSLIPGIRGEIARRSGNPGGTVRAGPKRIPGRLGGLLSEKVERGGDSIRFRKENGGDGFVSARKSGRNLSDVSLYGLSIIYYIIGVNRFSV